MPLTLRDLAPYIGAPKPQLYAGLIHQILTDRRKQAEDERAALADEELRKRKIGRAHV